MEPVYACSSNPATRHHSALPSVCCAAAAVIGEANGFGEVGWPDDVALGVVKQLRRDEKGQAPPLSCGGAAKGNAEVTFAPHEPIAVTRCTTPEHQAHWMWSL
uniref:Uncharacterized protein n=1 Tax=Oryza barthii TaxID=65489 RepID=A0A0D3GRA5_9ORYZ